MPQNCMLDCQCSEMHGLLRGSEMMCVTWHIKMGASEPCMRARQTPPTSYLSWELCLPPQHPSSQCLVSRGAYKNKTLGSLGSGNSVSLVIIPFSQQDSEHLPGSAETWLEAREEKHFFFESISSLGENPGCWLRIGQRPGKAFPHTHMQRTYSLN